VMNEDGNFIEIQGTAEAGFFSQDELNQMISLATEGIRSIIEIQKNALNNV